MRNTTTYYEKSNAHDLKPSRATIQNILNFSKAFSSQKLGNNQLFEMIRNWCKANADLFWTKKPPRIFGAAFL